MSRAIAETTLKDILDQNSKETMLDTNCHAIGVIESFNPTEHTCSIKINYKRTQLIRDSKGLYKKKFLDYPVLIDCPVIIMSGGSSALTFPISVGDSCLVLFNDRDIDNWFSGQNNAELASNRLHSLSDGIALVGVRSLRNLIESYDSENPHLFHDTAGLRIKSNKLELYNGTDKLGLLVRELIDAIKGITTLPCVSGSPTSVSVASQATLEAIAVKMEGLLE